MKKAAAVSLATVLILSLGVGCAKAHELNSVKNNSSNEATEATSVIDEEVLSKYYNLIDAYIEASNRYEASKATEAQEQISPQNP